MAQQGATIGRVNIKVLPDTTEFKREAQNQLDRIEKQLDLKLGIELDTARLKESLDRVARELQDWKKNHDPLKIGVEVNMLAGQTVGIATRLAYLTRPRTVTITPVMNEGALGGVATALMALSGGRVLGDLLENVWDIGKEFDRWAPKIGTAAMMIGSLSSLALAGISNMAALSLAVGQIATAGLALPGLFAGMAVGVGVSLVALLAMKDAMPDIFEKFGEMKDLIGKNFWAEAAAGIRSLIDLHLPELGATATATGAFFGSLAAQISGPFKDAIPAMFDNLNKSIGISASNTGVFASIMTILGQTGSEYLPRLATWFNNVSIQFDNFLKSAAADGSLQTFIDSGIQGFKDLGTVLLKAVQIVGDIGKAAQAGGGSTLGILADTMTKIRDVTSDPVFQATFTQVFATAHAVLGAIANQSGPAVTSLFKALADTFIKIGPALSEGLGTALGAIAGALADPALQSGIQVLFGALRDAIVALAPALPPVAQAIGALAPLLASLLGVIAPLITAALIPLSDIIMILAPALQPLIEALGGALLEVVIAITPALILIAQALADLVLAAMPLIEMALPLIVAGLTAALNVTGAVITGVTTVLAGAFTWIAAALTAFINIFTGGWDNLWTNIKTFFGTIWNGMLSQLGTILASIWGILSASLSGVKGLFTGAWTAIKEWLSGAWEGIKSGFSGFMSALAALPGAALETIKGLFTSAWTSLKSAASTGFENLKAAVKTGIDNAVETVKGLPGKAKAALGDLGGTLIEAGKSLIRGFIDGIGKMIGSVKDTLGDLTSKLTSWKGPESYDRVLLYDAGKLVIGGFINGLESQYDAVRRSLGGLSNEVGNFAVAAPNMGNLNGAIDGSLAMGGSSKVLNYYAAPGSSLGSEEDLFAAAGRARMVGW